MEEIVKLLSDTNQLGLILQNIASYLVYVYPGIITIYFYNFCVARTTKDTQAFVIRSFAISYVYNFLIQAVMCKICFLKRWNDKSSVVYNIILLFISLLVPYLGFRLKMSNMFASLCGYLGISTSVTDIPFELLGDQEESFTCLKIYLKDEPYTYIGYLGEYEYEDGHEKYVILTGYRKYYVKNHKEKLVVGNRIDNYKEKVYIKFDDIKRIEKLEEDRVKKKIYKEK